MGRVLKVLRIVIVAGALCCTFATAMSVHAQESGTAEPAALPLYTNCNLQECEIWFSVPGDIDGDAVAWQVKANGASLDLVPQAAEEQSVRDYNIMYVFDTSEPMRGQPLLDFREVLEQAPAQLELRGVDPALLEHMHTSVAFLQLYQSDPVTFWCNETVDGPCARNAPAWEYTNFRGVSNAVALMISNTAASNVKSPEFRTEFAMPFARALAAFDETDGPKIVICVCEGLGPSQTDENAVRAEEVDHLIDVARQENIRVHVKHAWKAPYGDASESLKRLAEQTGGEFVAEETAGIAPILDAMARELKPYILRVPQNMLHGAQGTVEFDIAYSDAAGVTRPVASASLDVPQAPIELAAAPEQAAAVPTPANTPVQGPVPTVPPATSTPPVVDPVDQLKNMPPGLLLAAGTVLTSVIGLGFLSLRRVRPSRRSRSMTMGDPEPTRPNPGTPTSEEATVRTKNRRPAAEFVLDYSPVAATERLLLSGDKGTWAIGRSSQQLKRNYPHAVPLTISSAHVSREHALLRFDGRQFMLEALLSSDPENPVTPVRVNDKDITLDAPQILHSGDLVGFSTAIYQFRVLAPNLVSALVAEQAAPGEITAPDGISRDPDDTWKKPVIQPISGR